MFTIFLVCLIISTWSSSALEFTRGDPRACYHREGQSNLVFEVLPGLGWDNLVNENRGVVISFNYSKCKTTDDGRYLIPDGIMTIPIKTSQMNVFSEVYEHWSQFHSDTSDSINVGMSAKIKGSDIAGSFSKDNNDVKKRQLEEKAFTTKTQVKFVRYIASVLPDSQLDLSFRKRLLKIAGYIQKNRKLSTKHECELLVRDFGTHVLTSVDVGASIVKLDHVASSLLEDTTTNREKIKIAATFSLPGKFSANTTFQFSFSKAELEKYMKNVKNSDIRIYGGPPVNPENFTLSKWTTTIGNDLVAVDRDGFPLDYVISTITLPELSSSLVEEIVQNVRTAISSYFRHNTYPGCTNPNAPNFSKISNVDDGSCHEPFNNKSFGGVYQQCSMKGSLINNENLCDEHEIKNPKTQAFSCPDGFEKVLLHKGTAQKAQHQHQCHRCWIFSHCCHDSPFQATANYTTYWCQSKLETKNSGYLFGGLFTDRTVNFVTQTRTCPQYYYQITIASTIHICISDDYELGQKFAVPFGGFYSCQNGNPFVKNNFTKSCPKGFSNHLATIAQDCEIQYCVRTGQLDDLKFPKVQPPPFFDVPAESIKDPADYIIFHNSESFVQIFDPKSKGFTPEESAWTTANSAHQEKEVLMNKFAKNNAVKLTGVTGVLTCFSNGFMTVICAIFVVRYR